MFSFILIFVFYIDFMYFWGCNPFFMIKNRVTFLEKCASTISNIFNPIVSLLSFLIYDCIIHPNSSESIKRFVSVFIFIIIPTIIWIAWNVKRGKYKDADVSNRKQRMGLYFFIEVCIFLYLFSEYFFFNHYDISMIFLMLLLITLHISNYFIKSSMHTAFNILAAALFFWKDTKLGILWICIAIIVGISRIILKRHTWSEIISGSVIAVIISALYLFYNIQQIFKTLCILAI